MVGRCTRRRGELAAWGEREAFGVWQHCGGLHVRAEGEIGSLYSNKNLYILSPRPHVIQSLSAHRHWKSRQTDGTVKVYWHSVQGTTTSRRFVMSSTPSIHIMHLPVPIVASSVQDPL